MLVFYSLEQLDFILIFYSLEGRPCFYYDISHVPRQFVFIIIFLLYLGYVVFMLIFLLSIGPLDRLFLFDTFTVC